MDLLAVAVLTLLLLPVIYGVPLEPLRVGLGLLLVLLFPGYVLIAAFFPRRENLDGVDRVALGLGLSLALVPLLGIALHFTPWGIRLGPMVLTLSLWNLALAAVAWRRRRSTAPEERFEPRWEAMVGWLQKPRRPAHLAVPVILALAVLAAMGAMAWRISSLPPQEATTEFYVLGARGMLQDYPTSLLVGEPQEYTIGIVNREGEPVSYSVRAFLSGTQVGSTGPLLLDDMGNWEGTIRVTPPGAVSQEMLELRLYRSPQGQAYRTVHLFVDVLAPDARPG